MGFREGRKRAHPLTVRLTHWVAAAAIVVMISSGWTIYNASPLFAFLFPRWAGLGGWLAAGIAWHIAAMWALFGAGIVYLAYGFGSGHFRRDVAPGGLGALRRDFVAALLFRLRHERGRYNAVQRFLYALVLVTVCLQVATGLAMWKPVQLGWLAWVFGGYGVARVIHFFSMSVIVGFLVVHLALVAMFPSTLWSMVTGGRISRETLRENGAVESGD